MDSSLIRVRPRKALPINKPLLLKDHLLDDMSSCSSNGFKSFPRRSQCCTAVRFLHDFDRKHKQQQKKYSTFNKKPSKPSLSAFRSVVAALKCLASAKTPEKIKPKCSSLGRSFCRRIVEKSDIWKKKKKETEQKVIGRWKSFDQLMKEESEPSAGFETNSWSSRDFTDDCSSGKCSSSEVNLNLHDVVQDGVGNGAVSTDSTTSSGGSSANTTEQKQWQSDQDKEQLSPVSVLDCPFVDEDEVSFLFQHRLASMEGTKMNLMNKIQRFECLAKVEPVNLATQFALQSDNSDNESSLHYSSSVDEQSISNIEEEEEDKKNEADQHKAFELLRQMKANYLQSYPDLKLKEDKLLQDFFGEKITYECANPEKQRGRESSFDEGLLEEAENWINGKRTGEHYIEWEVRKNRQAYVENMEKWGEWRTLSQEREEVGLELGNEVFVELMNEVLLDISI